MRDRFRYFCRHGQDHDTLTGSEAAEAKFKEVVEKQEAGGMVFKDLEPLWVYSYLLSDDKIAKLKVMTAECMKKMQPAPKAKSEAKAKSVSASAKAKAMP